MTSKRSHEGWLLRDNREAGGTLQEFAIYTCSHCQTGLIKNPSRGRERAYCPKCDHYICDRCKSIQVASGGMCKTFKQVIEEQLERAIRETGSITLL